LALRSVMLQKAPRFSGTQPNHSARVVAMFARTVAAA
jgi:hypothetical protein